VAIRNGGNEEINIMWRNGISKAINNNIWRNGMASAVAAEKRLSSSAAG
jgi:hypothetical protein